MAKTRHQSKMASYLILERDHDGQKEILMARRQNTGYMDGMYELSCAGHVEKDESFSMAIIREAKEELGIDIDETELEFLHINQQFSVKDSYYVDCFFKATAYHGTPAICEPEKCSDLAWFNYDHLPENTIPYLKNVLKCIKNNIRYDDDRFFVLKSRG